MVFIVRGNMESVGVDGNISPLKEGDVCGEELLIWCLEQSSGNKGTLTSVYSKIYNSFHSLRKYNIFAIARGLM